MAHQHPAPHPSPDLPPGGPVDLPGRGTTFVRDTGGERPVVLLLHGWGVTADLNWFTAYQRLARDHRVVALDHRGHGRGIRPPGDVVRLTDCADDAAALLDVLGIDRALVVGYSMGGAVAQLLWRRHPERVAALVLGSTARHFRAGPFSTTLYRAYTPVARAASVADGPARAVARRRIDRRVEGIELGPWVREELLRNTPACVISAMRSIGRFTSTAWIGELDVPAAVIVTTQDRTIPPWAQRRLAAAIPGARTFEVDGPHDSVATRPDDYVPVLADAIAAVGDP